MIISRASRAFLRALDAVHGVPERLRVQQLLGRERGRHDAGPGHAHLAAVVEHLAVVAELLGALVGGGLGDGGARTVRPGGRQRRPEWNGPSVWRWCARGDDSDLSGGRRPSPSKAAPFQSLDTLPCLYIAQQCVSALFWEQMSETRCFMRGRLPHLKRLANPFT